MGTQPDQGLLQRLEAVARDKPKLYHVTRTLLGARPALPPTGEPLLHWWSGTDAAGGWDEFLGANEKVFEAHEYERRSQWQQSGFYGDPARMNEYTLLAAEAHGALPVDFAIPYDSSGTLHIARDVWTLFLYRAALSNRTGFGLDTHGRPPYSDFVFPGLEGVIANPREESESEETMLNRFREKFHRATGRRPAFVYATLRVDVFTASVLGLRYLIENSTKLYGSPDDFVAMVSTPVAPPPPGGQSPASLPEIDGRKGAQGKVRAVGRNEDRDRWIYERCLAGVQYSVIAGELRSLAGVDWDEITTAQGIHGAAKRYAKRHGKPHPPRRRDHG